MLPEARHDEALTRRWISRAQAGDVEAFGELCRLYETPLLRHALTLCGNPALSEELAHDTLVEAWKGLRRYTGRARFFTWLCAILINRHRNHRRQNRLVPFSALDDVEGGELESTLRQGVESGSAPDEALQRQDESEAMFKCLQSLPPAFEEVVYLRFFVDDSLEEIAAALNCSVGTVKSRLFRALERLRGMHALKEQSANLSGRIPTP